MNTLELNVTELSSKELRTLEGGVIDPITVTAAGAAVVLAAIGGLYKAGEAIGKGLYHLFN
ncbi:hypothetical protein IWQ47_003264 [Aquimarina sp. EL_43]|uniref:Class IIb bacteriocin, lactobin A/cerein 7B family n=1 Tax=Aquimarina atlantica TaxID=1317122 RepID=A0A023BZ22_9FLAO|nr:MULTISPECIES: hypothetical protein [Aquimarina]EZH74898.1 hypothetical protein ATO12_09175 [Aquimarina atlantica]MBG6131994.1 hypothetical protein [Aquimarina sp. EL_35]MBG6149558.1 hypothetical protein [Aquimarina sp. EL_32]MBG6170179.1 hypothetical protein [Aquimarina sp. EL_43]